MASVRLEIDGPIGHVVLNRPEVVNVISKTLADDLYVAVKEANEREDVSTLVLRAEGKVFCAGGDMRDFGPDDPAAMPETIRTTAISLNRAVMVSKK